VRANEKCRATLGDKVLLPGNGIARSRPRIRARPLYIALTTTIGQARTMPPDEFTCRSLTPRMDLTGRRFDGQLKATAMRRHRYGDEGTIVTLREQVVAALFVIGIVVLLIAPTADPHVESAEKIAQTAATVPIESGVAPVSVPIDPPRSTPAARELP
jgi:hypothetical protein